MYSLEYLYIRNYKMLPNSSASRPVVQVVLSRESLDSQILFAIIDSGADYCTFSYEIGEDLGIEIFSGENIRMTSLGSSEPVNGYLHSVEMEVITEEDEPPWKISTKVAFLDRAIPRNILGRDGFFEYAKIGFVDREQTIYLSPYC